MTRVDGQSSVKSAPALLSSMAQTYPNLSRLGVLGAAALIATVVINLFSTGLGGIEERVGALGWTLTPDSTPEERITLVLIDEASIAEVGPWPWDRNELATLVNKISDAGALLQLHDITFPEPREGDVSFINALRSSSNTLISQVPVLDHQGDTRNVGLLTHPIAGGLCSAEGVNLHSTNQFVASAAGFSSIPKGHGAALIADDGAVRSSPAVICVGGAAYPSLAIAAFLQLGSANQWGGSITRGTSLLGPEAVLTLDGYPGLEIPLDRSGAMRVSFEQSPDAFQAISAVDIMRGRADLRLLENTIAIVGGTAFGMGDIVPTPYSGGTFGVELQARLVAGILDVRTPFTPVGAPIFLLTLCGLFGLVLHLIASSGGRVAAYGLPVAAVALPLAAGFFHILTLSLGGVWLGWMLPALFSLIAASGLLMLELGVVRFERSRVFSNLNSYLPRSVAQEIAFSAPTSSVNARRRDATLLSADLRNFSAFSEARPPEEIAVLLHYFVSRASEIIENHGGQLQEFRGDGILAIWDSADTATARDVMQAAEALQRTLNDRLLPDKALQGLEPLALGIGIEQGPVLVGSIGPSHRRSYTILGDTVAVTLRIQEMTAELAQPILVGECLARQLDHVGLESQGSYLLPGLRIPHVLFAPATSESSSSMATPKLSLVGGAGGSAAAR